MGLNTDFFGKFLLDRPLATQHRAVLEEFAGEEHEDENGKPGGDGKPPTAYCQWIPTEDSTGLEWDGAEKFYFYGEWLEYLIARFLEPWGYTLSGSVRYVGKTEGVTGTISVQNNVVVVTREPAV